MTWRLLTAALAAAMAAGCLAPYRPPQVLCADPVAVNAGQPLPCRYALPEPDPPEPPAVEFQARRGVVRLENKAFADDDGPYLAVGATMFWALWGYMNDRDRLEQNLRTLAESGAVDYIRVLGVVGPSGAWEDRTVTSYETDYDAAIAGLTDLAYDKYGLRVEWTIFGGFDSHRTQEDREALVRRFVEMALPRTQKIQHWEVVNEGQGLGTDDIRALGQVLREDTPNQVALTSAFHHEDGVRDGTLGPLYAGSLATLVTLHLERDVHGTGGPWRPVRQAREGQWLGWPWTSNEPIGPQSSVAEESDPLRLTMSAALTWLCAGAGYVYHPSAGIRGGGAGDLARGRAANLWEVPNIAATLAGIRAVREILPPDLPNWQWHNANGNFPGHPFETGPIVDAGEDAILRAFAMRKDDRFVVMPIAVREPVEFRARAAMAFEVRDPTTGTLLQSVRLAAGESYLLVPRVASDAFVLVGVSQ